MDWDNTKNVFIEGDNLEVLKILQKHYYGKIKMIYIDPPYNTGNDFVYNDDYADPIGSYLKLSGQADESGKLSTNSEASGRFHSKWLNMMYPRLKLARNLLTEDGVIFLSIDDNEQARLKAMCDEIFGEDNYINTFCWVSNLKGRQIGTVGAAGTKEYILCYSRKSSMPTSFTIDIQLAKRLMPAIYKGLDYSTYEDELGSYVIKNELYNTNSAFNEETRPNLVFNIFFHPETGQVLTGDIEATAPDSTWQVIPPHKNSNRTHKYHAFRWGREKVAKDYRDLHFESTASGWKVFTKIRDVNNTVLKDTILGISTSSGASDCVALGFSKKTFDFPKPVDLLKILINSIIIPGEEAFILDFFAGSGSIADAVLQLNSLDSGKRRFICAQLPESTPQNSESRNLGFKTISSISRERIRRSSKSYLGTSSGNGFRAYKLVDTNFSKWTARADSSSEDLLDSLDSMVDSARDSATQEEILTEVLLKLGFSLTEQIRTVNIAGLEAHSVDNGVVLAYLNEHQKPTLEQLRALVAELPAQLVILEDAFKGDDELKTNLAQECRAHDIKIWTV